MSILVTGGLGYIGSHTCVELLNNNYDVVIIDNLVNSNVSVKDGIYNITKKNAKLYIGDVRDKLLLHQIFEENKIDAVIHFAGLKAVGESNEIPLDYYDNNIFSTIALLEVMKEFKVYNFIFSSSATVYGNSDVIPITEDCKVGDVTCPYGRTKLFIEYILKDLYKSDNNFNIIILRYFNPIGAHPSALIGERPNGRPNNLVPYITGVASGKYEYLRIFGDDYNTKDGTGIRDYIHVCDLAYGHVCALKKVFSKTGLEIYNLGTGIGYSVFDVLHMFESIIGRSIPYKVVARREGDVPVCYADATKAYKNLGFKAKYDLHNMCLHQWEFEKKNI